MPTYAYRCFDCQHEFEASQKITEEPLDTCEKCGGNNVKRLLFASPFQLKGTGWYKTDYASSSSSGGCSHKNCSHKSNTESVTKEVEKPSSSAKSETTSSAGSSTSSSTTTPAN